MNTARPSDSQSVSSYTSSHGRKAKWSEKATQFLCNACLLCICCPLTVVWCCIKVLCKVGSHAAQHVRRCACGSAGKRVYASYSSFSDIDLDSLPGKAHSGTTCSKTRGNSKSRHCSIQNVD
ncbi:hypothetical protein ACFX2J_039300 [Malus domestica]